MEIYILRHGIADEPRPGMRDADRALTAEGKKRLREVLQVARHADVKPEIILTSPYRRARETAEIAREILHPETDLIPGNCFTPEADPCEAWEEVRIHRDAASVLIATHEPFAGLFAGYLLNTPALTIDVKKGSIIRVDVESFGLQPRGVLRWFLTPRLAAVLR
ncbi:MAG: histidine phosphatase family protein [Bryobacterales bacterium]|nr:histidine phosphatase family protein [Bryobacterales bacterium]